MKIGIITMHKVMNFGSVLQAYALQEKIKKLGFNSELINFDYYPPKAKQKIWVVLINSFIRLVVGAVLNRKIRRFQDFVSKNLVLSKEQYNKETITSNSPEYDIYMSGSDQVWNPRFVNRDTSFLLSFVPDGKKRLSYASSFAINKLPIEVESTYARELSKFTSISVREESGVEIVRKITGKEAHLVCDPTLLLDRNDWDKVAAQSKIIIPEKYILVYILTYMYNPYPQINHLIDMVQKELGNMKVVILEGSKKDYFRLNSKVIKDAGPNEFVSLFKNATFVITTSFHGTAFSLIYGKPFYSVIESKESSDNRMPSLLKRLDCEKSLITYDSTQVFPKKELLSLGCNETRLIQFSSFSSDFLQSNIY